MGSSGINAEYGGQLLERYLMQKLGLKGKTIFITGASRGIGKAIALKAAREGANIVVAAKTTASHPKLEGTIFSAAEEIKKAGGNALALQVDVRSAENIEKAIKDTVEHFGGIDIVVNNASAISLTGTLDTDAKRYDLMHQINTRGTFFTSKAALPYLLKSSNPHILNISPPLSMKPKWFGPSLAYTMAKYGMSMCVLGMAEEFKGKVAVNALWPKTTIATAAVKNILGGDDMIQRSRTPDIVADAAIAIFKKDVNVSGNFFLDEDVLRNEGVSDFDKYLVNPQYKDSLIVDLFLEEDVLKSKM
eukprot:TRINITY_DN986_c0_g3_i1.p1 TRINITY_DN986_c0_g3~~TRINITY_DN986_c0_g3_i1.p1  ORF type:complete len:304 (+),score=59.89 TRINITY_DN986_c0_g3_i1:10-921(+)